MMGLLGIKNGCAWYAEGCETVFSTEQEAQVNLEARIEAWLHEQAQWTADGCYIWSDEDKLARKEALREALNALPVIGDSALRDAIRNFGDEFANVEWPSREPEREAHTNDSRSGLIDEDVPF